jgi:CubicO group peptidase (beta-lactamase class C family)
MMNQHETAWLRKTFLLSIMVLAVILSVATFKPAFAQVAPANFEEVDAYISAKIKELGIPGAALVIVQGDQIVHLKAI